MSETTQQETSQEVGLFKRDEKGRLLPGHKGGPGRPKGKTLKEFAREFLTSMDDEAKKEFLNSLSKDVVWRMAEGNPHQTNDITTKDKPIAIYAGLSKHNSNETDIQPEEEN